MKVGDILRKKTARISTIRMNETVGIAAQLLVHWSLRILVGVDAAIGGGVEGLVIGAAVGLGYGAATSRTTGGLAAPSGSARTRVVVTTAAASAPSPW